MTDLGKFFQEMLDSSPSITLFVEEILKYYNLASATDKKFGAACIPKVASTLKSINENFALKPSDVYLDTPILPGSYIDMESHQIKNTCSIELLEIKQEDMFLRGALEEVLLRELLPLCKHKQQSFLSPAELNVPISQFCRNCIEMYFALNPHGVSKLGEYANNCKRLKDRVAECVLYLIGEMVILEVGIGNKLTTLQLSVEGASMLYYAARYLESQLCQAFHVGFSRRADSYIISEASNPIEVGGLIACTYS